MDALFDLDAVTDTGGQPGGLPAPVERRRLREESQLTLHQVADACGVSEATVQAWEGGTTPRGNNASTYLHLLSGLRAYLTTTPTPQPPVAQAPDWAALGALKHEIPTLAATPAPCVRCQQPTPQRVGGHPQHLGTRCPPPATSQTPPAPPTVPAPAPAAPPQRPPLPSSPHRPSRAPHQPSPSPTRLSLPAIRSRATANGPLAVLEASPQELTAHLADGRTLSCPANDLRTLLAWTVHNALGAAPLRPDALPAGPLLVLTPSALARLSLPATPPDAAQRHPRSDHPLLRQLRAIGWQTDDNGLGPWMRLYPSTGDPACDSIHLAVTDWGALHRDAWNLAPDLDAHHLADALGQYASLVRTPVGPPGACGHQLMSDVRPSAHRHAVTHTLVNSGMRGALTAPVDPAPCEAPPGHQLASHRAEDEALADSDIDWWRPPTAEEVTREHVVCLAVNLYHFAGSNAIRVADGPAHHVHHPTFNPKTPGSWLADLSAMPHRPLLPPAFAGSGLTWHTTPAIAYAAEHRAKPQPVQGWLRTAPASPYLDPWYRRIRLARLAVLERLGITDSMEIPDLLDALSALPQADGIQRALLHAIHTTVDGAFQALAQPPTQPDQAGLAAWPTPQQPTWRPDLHAAIIANARANLHRKLCSTARDGHYPLAIAVDHVLYATRTPHLSEITDTPNSGFRIGISPGHVRPVTVRPMQWFRDRCAEGLNAAQVLKETCPSW
ncbi:transcriptional regulator [Streptomyces antimycoticus]|uniref:Transcriptional regulator n=1 Tax=Streptomyces antimycoticus TaxID=68175 RepID=A0A499UKQ7_9ACTN|nr:transcriptional regulator [Streptomyces antimycoticus]